jgi:hypothetical protein
MQHRGLCTIAAVAALSTAGHAQEWTPAGTSKGVQLAFRDDATLDAREMRAIAELPYPATRVDQVVCDFTQPLDPDVREARVLSGDLQTNYAIYLRYSPRFMVVAARDVVINVERRANGCSWSEQPDGVPERRDAVRMPLLRGSWSLEPIDAAGTRVVYQVAVKPGGRIPGWLVRRGAASALPDVIERVSRCLSRTPAGGRC